MLRLALAVVTTSRTNGGPYHRMSSSTNHIAHVGQEEAISLAPRVLRIFSQRVYVLRDGYPFTRRKPMNIHTPFTIYASRTTFGSNQYHSRCDNLEHPNELRLEGGGGGATNCNISLDPSFRQAFVYHLVRAHPAAIISTSRPFPRLHYWS